MDGERFKNFLKLILLTKINNKCVRIGSNVKYKNVYLNGFVVCQRHQISKYKYVYSLYKKSNG